YRVRRKAGEGTMENRVFRRVCRAFGACGLLTVLLAPSALWAAKEKAAKPSRTAGEGFNLGVERYQAGDLNGARDAFRDAVAHDPKDAGARSWLGFVLLRQNRPDEAIPELEQAVALNPKNADAHNNLGNAYLAKGQAAKAAT